MAAFTTIKKSIDHFDQKLVTGNGGTQNITGLSFAPDLVWTKSTTGTFVHTTMDKVRGGTKTMEVSSQAAELTDANAITAFNSDGVSVGNSGITNASGQTYIYWNWKAGGSGSANTSGTLNTTATSANATAGFSIISYTGDGTGGRTIGHGLGQKPRLAWVKNREASEGQWWFIDEEGDGTSDQRVNSANQNAGSNQNMITFNTNTITLPSSSDSAWSGNGTTYIMYCWAPIRGYSAFGKYQGNGNADGPFVYTGFKPAWLLVKNLGIQEVWPMWDTKRDTANPNQQVLFTNSSAADTTYTTRSVDFLSNGFKIRGTDPSLNNNTSDIMYMAFAELPLVGDNPVTAK